MLGAAEEEEAEGRKLECRRICRARIMSVRPRARLRYVSRSVGRRGSRAVRETRREGVRRRVVPCRLR